MKATRTNQARRPQCAVWIALVSLSALLTVPAGCGHCAKPKEVRKAFAAELTAVCEEYRFPGITAAYILPDGTVEGFATGFADIEENTSMTVESRMLAASIGKTFVAATTLALEHEGALRLDDPVSKWLGDRPWYARLPNHETVTVRQLLAHRSGMPNHVETAAFAEAFRTQWQALDEPFSAEQLIAFVLDQPALFPAGEGWRYSDTGYILAGLVIEAAAGHTYYEEVSQRFLEPLSLSSTTASDRVDLPGLAAGYLAEDNAFGLPKKTITPSGSMAWNPVVEWTGGGLISNPRDLVVWAKSLFEGDAFDGNYLDDLLKGLPIDDSEPHTRYGLGVAIHEESRIGRSYGHGGWIPGYCSSLRYYPDYGIAVAFQINTDIGIVDSSAQVVEAIEIRLAQIVMDAQQEESKIERSR